MDDVQDAIDLLKAHDIPVPDLLEDNLADYEMIRDGLAAASVSRLYRHELTIINLAAKAAHA